MDVGHLRKACSGSAFLDYGTGDVGIKILGDQDEDVDIDDGDSETAPYIDASLAGVSGSGTGVGTGAKSMAGSTHAARVGVANVVSSMSSHGRREPHTAGSQASIGRQTLPQLTAGEDGSPKHSDGSVPKVYTEGTSKRVHANESRIPISETNGRVRRLSSVQTLSNRKVLETGPSTSSTTKRAKLHGNSSDSRNIVRKNNKTEEVQPRETALRTRKEDLPLKRKEIIKDEDGGGSDKCPRASEMVRKKGTRMLVFGDESDEDMLERDEAPVSPKSDGEGKKVSGVKVATEMSLKNDSHAVSFAKTGLADSGKKVVRKQSLLLAVENNLVPLRSAFPLHAKKKVHPSVPGDSKSNTGAGFAARITDENSPRKWISCPKCRKIRFRSQRLQKSLQTSYRPFSQINSIFRLLLIEPLKSNEDREPPAAASLPVFEAVKEEEAVDFTECDGRGYRKTLHLQCLDPLEEVPETAFHCPSCLAKASTPPGVEGGTSAVEEPAPLFAESDHPINMITGDSAQVFWGSSLQWRHDDWQAKKGNTLGKVQRGKKLITYDEDTMASAVFNKAQISEASERKRPRRRKGSSEEAQEVVTAPSDPVSFKQRFRSLSSILHSDSILPVTSPQVDTALPCDSTLPVTSPQVDTCFPCDSNLPVTSTQVDTAFTSVIPEREQLQESTDPVRFQQGFPSLSSGVHFDRTLPVTSPQVDTALPCGSSLLVTSTQVDTALPCDNPDKEQLQENTDPVSFQQWLPSLSSSVHSDSILPVTSTEVDTVLPSDIPEREQLQENTVSSPSHQSEVARSAHESLRNDHATNQNAGSERNRSDAPGMLAFENFPAYLSKICSMLDLPGPAQVRAGEIFKYFLQCQKQIRRSRPHHEIFAIQLCVVWMAANQFNHAIDKEMSICLVEERLCVSYTNHDQFVGELYKKVKEICDNFTPRPAPLVNVPTTPQPALIPEITPPRTSLLNHPPIAGFEPSPGNVLPQAINAAEPARNQLEGSQGTGLQVETELVLPESQSVETLPGDNALEVEGAQTVVEPVRVEVGTQAVLVEADPRLVPEEPSDMLISQSRVPEYDPIQVLAGTITSGDSSLEQGLGWVLGSPVPEISVGDLSLTGQPLEASGSERLSNSESHIGSSPCDEAGLASATLGASPMEVPRQAGSVTEHVYPDVLLKEKENLSIKDVEKAKAAYESEAQRIKAEYDREAEILHKKYEALLVEQHRSFTRRQQEVQLNIVKVEWNRQLAETLELRKELAACAAVFAGLASQTAVQPLVNQQAPQQISGRPRTTVVPVHASISRCTTNTVNAGSGITMQSPGISSTRVSTAPVHHSPRYGMPQNEQLRSSMSEAMAALPACVNGVGSGFNATGSSQAQMESVPPEMNMDVNGSPQPRTSTGVLAPTSPSFQDPILAISRNNMPSVEANSPSPSETVSSAGASLPNPHLSEPTAGMEYQIQHSQASPQTNPGVDSAPMVEGIPVQMTSQVRFGAQEQVANVATLAQNVIYLSDSDD